MKYRRLERANGIGQEKSIRRGTRYIGVLFLKSLKTKRYFRIVVVYVHSKCSQYVLNYGTLGLDLAWNLICIDWHILNLWPETSTQSKTWMHMVLNSFQFCTTDLCRISVLRVIYTSCVGPGTTTILSISALCIHIKILGNTMRRKLISCYSWWLIMGNYILSFFVETWLLAIFS